MRRRTRVFTSAVVVTLLGLVGIGAAVLAEQSDGEDAGEHGNCTILTIPVALDTIDADDMIRDYTESDQIVISEQFDKFCFDTHEEYLDFRENSDLSDYEQATDKAFEDLNLQAPES
jgi:hypothetical protein